jgi:hypothetical protein
MRWRRERLHTTRLCTLGGGEGGVQVYDLPGSSDDCLIWATGCGGNLRQGRLGAR